MIIRHDGYPEMNSFGQTRLINIPMKVIPTLPKAVWRPPHVALKVIPTLWWPSVAATTCCPRGQFSICVFLNSGTISLIKCATCSCESIAIMYCCTDVNICLYSKSASDFGLDRLRCSLSIGQPYQIRCTMNRA